VTGARGRLGQALVQALAARGGSVGWSRPEYDLDDSSAASRLLDRDQPRMVIHCAAWTDVDGCAREPELAARRNATATEELARAAATRHIPLVLVSTNEVFDGERADGRGYGEGDTPRPANPYGASKLAGELAASTAYAHAGADDRLWIVRTAWLFGPPGADFPLKILAAADRLPAGQGLRVVTDEIGSPTYTRDLAGAIVDLVDAAPAGIYHLAAPDHASRYEVARAVLERCRPARPLEAISSREFARVSNPPSWGVLDTDHAARYGVRLRPWRAALDEYLAQLC
jgi:dTDP-4-dehydrorhamnose reductase